MTSNAAKLYRKIMSDKSAQTELAKAGAGTEVEGVATIVKLGEACGLPVTPEEVREFLAREPGDELSDAELEMVVGGKTVQGDFWSQGTFFNDLLFGGWGDDDIYGGWGEDTMFGGAGNDSMEGGSGNDIMYGGSGNDDMHGDYAGGGLGKDHMEGGAGNDSMRGGGGADTMLGGTGNDSMWGEDSADKMSGGTGDDAMDGGWGNDTMSGGTGDDKMWGGRGNDTMDGGAGNDTIWGGGDNDLLRGGGGNDVFVFGTNDGGDIITDFNQQEDRLLLQGAEAESLGVSIQGGNTVITFGYTTITLAGVEMDKDEVLACADF